MATAYEVGFGIFTPTTINQFHDAFSELSTLKIKQSILYNSPESLFNISFSRTSLTASLFITVFDREGIITAGSTVTAVKNLAIQVMQSMLVIANLSSFNVSSVISENESEINQSFSNLFN